MRKPMQRICVNRNCFQAGKPGLLGWFLVLVIAASGSLLAGDKPDSTKLQFAGGLDALQFQIDRNFSLSDFQGALFSWKHHFSSNKALRIGVDIRGNIENADRLNTTTSDGNSVARDISSDGKSFNAGITSQFIFYTNPENRVKLFLGSGPFFRINYDDGNSRRVDQYSSGLGQVNQFVENHTDRWDTGLSNVLGLEFAISKNISLTAENSFLLGYHSGNFERITTSTNSENQQAVETDTSESSGFYSSSGNVLFGLSVYF